MKVLRCPGCGAVKVVPRSNKTCSLKCAHRVRQQQDPVAYAALMRKAGRARGLRSKERAIRLWTSRCPGVPVTSIRKIYNAAYSAAYRRGQQTGFRHGYEAAQSGLRLERTA